MKSPRKFIQNVIVDSTAFVAFILLTTTGVLMKYILPPGSGHHTTIWGFDRHAWGDFHFWVAVVMFGALTLHLFLHWNWIAGVFTGKVKNGSGQRFLLGVVGLITVVMLAISPLLSPKVVQENTGKGGEELPRERGAESEHEDETIRGFMTLQEVVDFSGVPREYILKELNLPEDIPESKKIGQMRNEYDFDMDQLRKIIRDYH